MTADPTRWQHEKGCAWISDTSCSCGLSAVRDAIDQGHRVVIGAEGVGGRLDLMGEYERRAMYGTSAFVVVPLEPS